MLISKKSLGIHWNQSLWLVVALATAHFVIDWLSNAPSLLLVYLKEKYDLLPGQVGFGMSLYALSASALQVPLGAMFQRLGWLRGQRSLQRLQPLVVGSVLLTGLFMSMVPFGGKIHHHFLWLVAAGTTVAAFHPLAAGSVFMASQRNQAFWMGIFISGGVGGFAFGPWFVGSVLNYDVRYYPPLQLGITLAATGCTTFLFLKSKSNKDMDPESNELLSTAQGKRTPWGSIFNLSTLVILRESAKLGMITYWPIWMHEHGWSTAKIGVWLTMFLLPGPLLGWAMGAWADRVGGRQVLAYSQCLTLAGWLLFFSAPLRPWGLAGFIWAGTALVATSPINVVMAQAMAPHRLGLVSALTMGFAWGIAGLTLPIIGKLAELWGLETTLHYPLFVSLLSLGLITFLPRHVSGKESVSPYY